MKHSVRKFLRNNAPFFLFIVLLFSFRSSVADWYHVPSGSMEPTIHVGDRIVVDKSAYSIFLPFTDIEVKKTAEIARGDIVIINSSAADMRLVKRVVGVEGDVVSLHNNTLTINGETATLAHSDGFIASERLLGDERHIKLLAIDSPARDFDAVIVPDDHVLVMGDNRNNSVDSRYYGFIPISEIQGKATSVAFSLDTDNYYLPRASRLLVSLD
jgi:signal peptidase I